MHATALDAALAYASRGWHVFPVAPSPNKRPLTPNGFHAATTDHAQIVAWWTDAPSAQVGVACGASGILTVDLDEKPEEGISGLASLLELGADADECALVMGTPRSGGRQMFYAHEGSRKIGVRPGLDLLGDGGYTIVPSPSSPGRAWLIGDPLDPDDLEEPPRWLLELLASQTSQTSGTAANASDGPTTAPVTPLGDEVLADIRAALAVIPNDDRALWIKVGMALKSTAAGEQAYTLWDEWSKSTPTGAVHPKYDAHAQRYQWQRLKVRQDNGGEIGLPTLFYVAQEHGYVGPAHDDGADIRTGGAKQGDAAPVDLDAPLLARSSIDLLDWEDVATLPPIEWQIEGLIPRHSLTVLAGDTEAGKSFCWIDLAMRLVHGLPFAGMEVEPGSVLYLAGEGQAGMAARFRAWKRSHRHLGLDAGDRYCVVSSEIPVLSKRTMNTLHEMVKAVTKWKGHPPAMIIIDTLSQGLEEDENEAKVVSPIVRGLMALRSRWGSSIGVAHHLVKMGSKGRRKGESAPVATRDSIRGSGALTRNVDTVLGLTTDGEARSLQVWKQKDGSKLEPITMWLHPVPTGGKRSKGQDEWSCIMIPDGCGPLVRAAEARAEQRGEQKVEDPRLPNDFAMRKHADAIEKVVATLEKMGAVEDLGKGMSGQELVEAMGVRRGIVYAAIKGAAREGQILNQGTAKSPVWVVPKQPGTADSAGTAD